MSVITKDLGVATAYGYAKSKGYTGTEEEFAELMASYADVAQQAETAAQDAEDAKDAAVSAKNDAVTAKTAAESAQTAAAGSAQTASTKATEASNSAQTAAGSATSASDSATAAAGSASTAQTAAQTATSKASEASSSASAASTAKTGAETARTGAQAAQTAAETAQANAETAAASVSASAAQIETNTEEIGALKNDLTNGTFPVGNAENADQLTSTVGVEDKTPYLFRTSGGSVDIGDRETVNKIVGGTIVNNQLLANGDFASASGWRIYDSTKGSLSVSDGTATLSYTTAGSGGYLYGLHLTQSPLTSETGHKFFVSSRIKIDFSGKVNYEIGTSISNPAMLIEQNKWVDASVVCNKENSGTTVMIKPIDADIVSGSTMQIKGFVITDLTQDFGTSIADYVYSLEAATAGAGVAWLKKHFPKQFDAGYQAYDAGSMQSVSGLTAHKMVGFNQWDGTYEENKWLDDVNGTVTSQNGYNVTDFIKIFPNTVYYKSDSGSGRTLFYDANKTVLPGQVWNTISSSHTTFTTPPEAHYIRFVVAPNFVAAFIINLHWDGEKDGTYEPYKTWSYALDDSVVIRGIPKVDANGNLYYDGDEYLPDGTVNRRFGIVDLGTLDYVQEPTGTYGRFYTSGLANVIKKENGSLDLRCPLFMAQDLLAPIMENANMMWESSNGNVSFSKKGYDNASEFKTAMSGVYLLYPLDTPTTETALPYQATQIVDNWGTEEYVLSDGAFPVPVGHDTMYQNNLRAKLEMSPESPDGDGLYVVQQESGENTYVPLASTATIQDILTRLTALENA